ncbi:MAG TPA: DCC1-like thiol-disulfide oxidoreductase family protein [Bacteroidia bacterium]|nr:DCC1-like thiol-disulfide oxidoreductase family protein [Bacteroidia bacterium]HQF29297.1 DCC1-like thiol-disulfide oxidoreductase family protein [Bacteroidia bacterium]HQK98706.1 DCC1-like thiol-disulfide oxidoreductase family protein [Bacteroidia bacterium]
MDKAIIIFDGVCNFCSRTVDIIIKADHDDHFRFVASQTESGRALLSKYGITEVTSVCLIQNENVYLKSDAALEIARRLSIPWRWFAVLKVVPLRLRDAVYSFIAARRYRWFGKRESCKVPDEKYRSKFIE